MMKECVIAIIGAGATAVSLLQALVDEARAEPRCPRLVVYLIETRRLRGRGLAYEDDLASNLLNTRAGFITPFPQRPGHFFAWLQANEAAWRHEFPGLVVEADTFVPRPLFGLYLECMMGELAGELMRIGGTLVPVTAEATDLEPTPEGRVVVSTDTALAIRADRVVLSCGNLQAREEGGCAGWATKEKSKALALLV
ncbi:FAD/NAD(P)-binding protein [Salinarimonas ramus]|nr:FAD/NAD(P)-binding protein [Salinarimonas ramus]